VPLSYRVTGRMRLNKTAGTIEVNNSLTLSGIPFNYVLGTRSALEWVVDQYRLEEDEGGTVTSDPNDPQNERYIVHLIERVTTVSIDTMALSPSYLRKWTSCRRMEDASAHWLYNGSILRLPVLRLAPKPLPLLPVSLCNVLIVEDNHVLHPPLPMTDVIGSS
jgi:hypothetical protein